MSNIDKDLYVAFLYEHMEQYRDKEEDIRKALDFAMKDNNPSLKIIPLGGFILGAYKDDKLVGSVVVNRTGMNGYIPDNILVFIATHKKYRGEGIGKQLMHKALELSEGDVALHVEPDNPARFLYEKVGFTNKYLEMRYVK